VYLSLHLDTSGYDVCAEPIALSNALAAGDENFKNIVALYWNGNQSTEPIIVAPCGECRQMLIEYAPDINVILESDGNIKKVSMRLPLPFPYTKPALKNEN
jgi:cytidine deaminase